MRAFGKATLPRHCGDVKPPPAGADDLPMTLLRLLAGLLALLALAPAFADLFGLFRGGYDPMMLVFAACTLLFVALSAWFALRGHRPESRARMKMVLLGGLIVGAIAFAIGFFGPLAWAPDANQGPLLGIFITGPIGFVVGSMLGWIYARVRGPQPSRTTPA
jgi:hypothetical protein